MAVPWKKIVQVTYRRSGPMIEVGQPGCPAGIGVFEIGAKHVGVTSAGRGPAVM